jgi:hypothetical protein
MNFGLHDIPPVEKTWNQMFGGPMFPRTNQLYRNGEPLDVAFCLTLIASPLGAVLGVWAPHVLQRNGLSRDDLSEPDLSEDAIAGYIRHAKSNIAAYLLENSCADKTYPEQYADLQAASSGGDVESFIYAARMFSYNRRFYLTQSGYMGIGPEMMRPGDQLCVLFGGRPAYILRPMDGYHVFIGDTYVNDQDIMWRKATESAMFGKGRKAVETFELR